MPVISNERRTFSVDSQTISIPRSLSFHNNCEVHYNQRVANALYRHVKTMVVLLDTHCPGEYWAIGGTLLGALRWQTILPWDDDFDFAVTTTGYASLLAANARIQEDFGYDLVESAIGMKVYDGCDFLGDLFVCDYLTPSRLVYAGPFINGVSYFYTHQYVFHQIAFRHTDVFPIVRKPFGAFSLPCPRKYNRIVCNNYNDSVFTTIKLPNGFATHATLPKAFYIASFKTIQVTHLKFPYTTQLIFVLIGLMIHCNMHGVYNGRPFMRGAMWTDVDMRFMELVNPEVVRHLSYIAISSVVNRVL
jgi:hypothetical protein